MIKPPNDMSLESLTKWAHLTYGWIQNMPVAALAQTISTAPTKAEVEAIQNKLNELILYFKK